MRFQMLGPLRIWDGARWTFLAAAQQRVVLAMLLANVGRVVRVEQLIDEIWGADPPRTALATVQVYVSRLRKMLGWGVRGPLSTLDRAYHLAVEPDDVDAQVFEELATAGRRDVAAGRLEVGVERLSRALALWRGPALADVPASAKVDAEIARLERARLTAMEERFGALLDLRRPAEAADELGAVVRQHPLRERLWAQLMRALYQSGRRSEALAAYREAREVIRAELGLDPGPELRDTHRAVLADDPRLSVAPRAEADRPVPAQLPADVAGFTGREAELRRLDGLVSAHEPGSTAVVLATITGPAGVGKTALAVRWAHRVRDRFPGGQLYLDLHGHAGGGAHAGGVVPMTPREALGRFLAALGVRPERVPADVDEAAALFRSLVSGRRLLVLLDDANHPDQVRPLLPGDARCTVVVTSRDRLDGLVARDGAARLALDGLRPDDARQLLARMLGAERAGAEPAALDELARLCRHRPLALRLAGAHLSARPHVTVAGYTDRFARPDGARLARAGTGAGVSTRTGSSWTA